MAPQDLEAWQRHHSELARICKDLINKYATPTTTLGLEQVCRISSPRESAARQRERFLATDLDVFSCSANSTSLDCEIRDLAAEELAMIQMNLEFAALHDAAFTGKSGVLSSPENIQRREWIQQLEGTPSEALGAIEAAIDRLDELGQAIRRRQPVLSQRTQVEDAAVDGDGEGHGPVPTNRLAWSILLPSAHPSLQNRLAASVVERHNYLRQQQQRRQPEIAQHHQTNRGGTTTPTKSPIRGCDSPESQSRRQSGYGTLPLGTSRPGSRRPRNWGHSTACSSQSSAATTAEDNRVEYPEPPKAEHGMPAPRCPYCREALETYHLSQAAWKRHVDEDVKPYICLFDICNLPSTMFPNREAWERHMKDSHGTNWPHRLGKFPNDQQPSRTGTQSSSIKTRKELVCPLCHSWSPAMINTPSDDFWKESYKLDRMSEHIANHLLRFAVDTLNSSGKGKLGKSTHQTSLTKAVDIRSGQDPLIGEEAINIPNEACPSSPPEMENRAGRKQGCSSTCVCIPSRQRSPDDETTDIDNSVDWNSNPLPPSSKSSFDSCSDDVGTETMHQQEVHLGSQLSSPEHPQSLPRMFEMARALYRQRKYQEAEEEYRKALKLHAKVVKAKDRSIIPIKCNLANALAKQDKNDEAKALYEEVLLLSAENYGRMHPHTLSCRSNLASLLEKKDEYSEAEQIYRDVLLGQTKTLRHNHPDTLASQSKLAQALMMLGSIDRARDIYVETLEKRRQELGEEHPDTIITLGNFANSLQSLGQFEQAKKNFLEAKRLGEKVLDHEHPHLQWIRSCCEKITKDQGKG